ncbi:MAG: type I phosphomannose isomerase catalytic subunit [Chthoniobacterales bacterium]
MEFNDPLFFEPLFMERVWGGSHLQTLFDKHLPHGSRIGESWEIVDREEAQSVVHIGPLKGSTLQELWTGYRADVFGKDYIAHPSPRFPLLFKLLDAQERLSIQVHPPAALAPILDGEPKTEMWYIVDARLDHAIFAGVKKGTTRDTFQQHLDAGTVEEIVQRIPVESGDAIFIPSGRLHAIGAGNVIVEIQQNSDTTYRVFDWNRLGLDGQPRQLHVEQSLQSIDYNDTDPQLLPRDQEELVRCDYFRVEKWEINEPRASITDGRFCIITVLTGRIRTGRRVFSKGEFFLVPPTQKDLTLYPVAPDTTLLRTTIPI